jgi:hypothetical protein
MKWDSLIVILVSSSFVNYFKHGIAPVGKSGFGGFEHYGESGSWQRAAKRIRERGNLVFGEFYHAGCEPADRLQG